MSTYGPLRALLFFYECLRFLLLLAFIFLMPQETATEGGFPCLVYLSANALFPLMALFVWLRPEEYRSYLNLYAAGKIIAVVSFYAWEIFSSREFRGFGNFFLSLFFLGSSVFISLTDVLSVWGAWTIKNKFRKALSPEGGGV